MAVEAVATTEPEEPKRPDINWDLVYTWLVPREKPLETVQTANILVHVIEVAEDIDDFDLEHNAPFYRKPVWRKITRAAVGDQPAQIWVPAELEARRKEVGALSANTTTDAKIDNKYLKEDTADFEKEEDGPLELAMRINTRYSIHNSTHHAVIAARLMLRDFNDAYEEPPPVPADETGGDETMSAA